MSIHDEIRMDTLCRSFQLYIGSGKPSEERTAEFTIDGAAYYRITPAQRAVLMALAPLEIRYLNTAGSRQS